MSKYLDNQPVLVPKEPSLSSERPIGTLAEDELGRRDFAASVAKVIAQWKGRDSLVLAIYGPWGSGKSSIKNMILDSLTQQKANTISLEFNPWEWAGQEKVFQGFFSELSAKLGSKDESKKAAEAANSMRMYGAMLSAAGSFWSPLRWIFVAMLIVFGLVGVIPRPTSPIVLDVLRVFGVLALLAAGGLAAFGRTVTQIATYLSAKSEVHRESVADARAKLHSLLGSFDKNFVVVVDDVDRLTPDGIRMVFQLVKANADFPNLIYLLLLQRDTIEAALGTVGKTDGGQFLEKVVQVGFDIPKLSSTKLDEVLETAIGKIVQETPAAKRLNSKRWAKLFVTGVKPYFRNLRDVKRFSSSLAFHFELYRSGQSFDANPVDLVGLEVLRQFEPSVYQRLYFAKELLTGSSKSPLGLVLTSEVHEAAKALLANAVRPVEAKAILVNVFPPLAKLLAELKATDENSRLYEASSQGEWLKNLRPCHVSVFERYFRFSLAAEDLSESELSALLAATSDRSTFAAKLMELNDKGLLAAAVTALVVNSQLVPEDHIVSFAIGLLDLEKHLFLQRGKTGVASVPIDVQAVLIIRAVLQERPVSTRFPVLGEIIAQTKALYLPMISFEWSAKERLESIDPLVSESEAKSLVELWVGKIKRAVNDGELLSHPWLRHILQFWRQCGSENEVSKWFADTLSYDSGLLALLQAFVDPMNLVDDGQITSTQYRFALEEFSRYIEPSQVSERVRSLVASQSSNRVCQLFIQAFDRWKKTGQMPYPQNLGEWTTPE